MVDAASFSSPSLSFLQQAFRARVGALPVNALVRDVAFPLAGGLEGALAAFNGEIEGADIYARPHNPTVTRFADAVNRLESGAGAVAYASGQAAIRNVFQILTEQGSEIILSNHIFGGTSALGSILSPYGVTFKWADAADPESFAAQITERTRALFVESVANPGGEVAELDGLGALARAHRIPLVVDNTTAPLLLEPAAHGAHIVVYSATKYLNGFGNAPAGVAIDAGNFAWEAAGRHGKLIAPIGPAPSLSQRFGHRALFKGLQSQLTVDGSILAPEKAATIYTNLDTLPERLCAHVRNTAIVAAYLDAHPAVERVHYAGLPGDPSHARAQKYLPHGVTGPILVTLKGGRAAAAHVIDHTGDAFFHAVNIGDATKNLISHPATTTHRQLTDAQKEAVGIREGSLRLSLSAGGPARALEGLERALRHAPR